MQYDQGIKNELKRIVLELLEMAQESKDKGHYTFLLNKFNTIIIDGKEYGLKLQELGA